MKTISGGSYTKQHKKILQANDKLYEGMELPIKSSPEHQDHQANIQDHNGR